MAASVPALPLHRLSIGPARRPISNLGAIGTPWPTIFSQVADDQRPRRDSQSSIPTGVANGIESSYAAAPARPISPPACSFNSGTEKMHRPERKSQRRTSFHGIDDFLTRLAAVEGNEACAMHVCVRSEYRKFQKQQRWSSPPKRYSTTASHSATCGSFAEPPADVKPGRQSCDSSTSSGGIKPHRGVAAIEAPEKGSPPDSPQRTRSLA